MMSLISIPRTLVAAGGLAAALALVPSSPATAATIDLVGLTADGGYTVTAESFTAQAATGVDGTFGPDTDTGELTTVSTTGLTADLSALSSTNSTFGSIFADNAAAVPVNPIDNPPTGVTVNSAFYAHNNGGITFDLNEIVPVGETPTNLSFIFGYIRNGPGVDEKSTAVTYAVLVDGDLRSTATLTGQAVGEEYTPQIVVPLALGDRFLSLVSLDGNDGIGNDHTAFINPAVTTVIPEPASLALLGLGGLLMIRKRAAR